MLLTDFKKVFIEGVKMKELQEGDTVIWKGGYTNLVPLSTEADGKTIYNGGLGYKDGYRVRSGGAEGGTNVGSCTGFIKATSGDVVRLSGYDIGGRYVDNAINVSDINRNNLGQIVGNNTASYGCFAGTGINWNSVISEGNGVYYWIVPAGYGIEYIRVSGRTAADGSKMIVTVNEEIE